MLYYRIMDKNYGLIPIAVDFADTNWVEIIPAENYTTAIFIQADPATISTYTIELGILAYDYDESANEATPTTIAVLNSGNPILKDSAVYPEDLPIRNSIWAKASNAAASLVGYYKTVY